MIPAIVAVLLAVAAGLLWLAHGVSDTGEQVGGKHKARGNADRWDR